MAACGLATLFAAALLSTVACGEEPVPRGNPNARPAAEPAPQAPAAEEPPPPAEPPPEVVEAGAPSKGLDLPESAFVETDENRDPFRSYIAVFNVAAIPSSEDIIRQEVLLEDHALDELHLVAIVSGQGGNPRAMLVDPQGKGWVVRRGDYVGRGERIRLGPGQPEREINWRVVRVRPDRIIFVRDDPVQAGPQVTRVMRLYPEEDS